MVKENLREKNKEIMKERERDIYQVTCPLSFQIFSYLLLPSSSLFSILIRSSVISTSPVLSSAPNKGFSKYIAVETFLSLLVNCRPTLNHLSLFISLTPSTTILLKILPSLLLSTFSFSLFYVHFSTHPFVLFFPSHIFLSLDLCPTFFLFLYIVSNKR